MNISQLHNKAVDLSKNYLHTEGELLTVLMDLDSRRAFGELGYTGIFNYCLNALKFSESQANYFSSVAKKSREVPELKKAIDRGVLSVSKARRIVKVITPSTQAEWIRNASEMKQVELDKAVAAVNPSAVKERIRPVGLERHEMRLSIADKCKAKLDRAKNLMKESGLESVLEKLLDSYLEKHDPIKKAERTFLRKVKPSTAKKAIPAQVRHAVNLRDQGKCQVEGCPNERYVDLHHIIHQPQGGKHTEDNLITLCSAHHRIQHRSAP
jgi:hypothetical protein